MLGTLINNGETHMDDPPNHASPFEESHKSMAFLTGARERSCRQQCGPDFGNCPLSSGPVILATEPLIAEISFFESIEAL